MLGVDGLESGYGPMQVLWGVSFEVVAGGVTALLGPNGVGKSTTLMAILGSIKPWGGRILYKDRLITQMPSHKKVELGIAMVPEGRHLFQSMTVHENLIMGAYSKRASRRWEESRDRAYSLFPILAERQGQAAGTLSGGEQQMLTIARSLMTRPELLMLDEPSQGLAPKLVGEVFDAILRMKADLSLTMLLVEQNADMSLGTSDFVFIMHEGVIKASGTPEEIKGSGEIREAYLGI